MSVRKAGGLLAGRYRVEAPLGGGQYGALLCEDLLAPGVRRVLKALPPVGAGLGADRVLAGLAHPHLGHVLAVVQDGAQRFAVEPFYAGRRPVEGLDLLRWLGDVLRGLEVLHRAAVVHADLKPGNVVTDAEGGPRIVDLGLALRLGERPEEISGTPAYLAPEALQAARSAPAADLFSFGVMAYELLVGRLPLPGAPAEQLRARSSPTLQASLEMASEVAPPALRPWLGTLLQVRPDRRYPSARAALEALAEATAGAVGVDTRRCLISRLRPRDLSEQPALEAALSATEAGVSIAALVGRDHVGRAAAIEAARRRFVLAGWRAPEGEVPARLSDLRPWLELPPGPVPSVRAIATELIESGRPTLLCVELSAPRPLLVRLCEQVARLGDTAEGPTLILVGAETGESEVLRTLERHAPVSRVDLAPLDEAAIARRLSLGWTTSPAPLALVRALRAQSEGLPGRLERILVSLARAGRLPLDDGSRLGSRLPEAEAPSEPLAGLSQGARDLLRALKLYQGGVPRRRFEGLTRALGMTVEHVEELLSRQLAEWVEGARGTVIALDPLLELPPAGEPEAIAEAMYRHLGARTLREGGDEPAARLARLARIARAPEAGRLALRAADDALESLDPEQALEWLDLVLERDTRAEVWARVVEAAALLGRSERVSAALEQLSKAPGGDEVRLRTARGLLEAGHHRAALDTVRSDLAAPAGEASDAAALAVAARACVFTGDHALGRDLVAKLRALGAPSPPVRVTEGLLALYGGELDRALEALESALADPDALPGRERPFALNALGMVRQRRGELDEAAVAYAASRDRARAIGMLPRVATAALNLATLEQQRGRLGRALAAYDEALSGARAAGDDTLSVKVSMNAANALALVGRLDEARARMDRAERLARGLGNPLLLAYVRQVAADIARLRGALDEAVATADEAARAFEALGASREVLECEVVAARAELSRSALEAASSRADKVLAAAAGQAGLERYAGWAHVVAAECAWRGPSADLESVRRHLDAAAQLRLTRHEDLWPLELARARLASREGAVERARGHARSARSHLMALANALEGEDRERFVGLAQHRSALDTLRWIGTEPGPREEGAGADAEFFRRVLEVNTRLLSETSVQRLLEVILDEAIALTGAERGFILLAEHTGGDPAGEDTPLKVRIARNIDRETLARKGHRVSMHIARDALREGRAVITVDALSDERFKDHLSVHAIKLRSVVCVPLVHRGRRLGVVYLDHRYLAGAFTRDDLDRLGAFAGQAAIALATAEALEELTRRGEALDKAQAQLAQANARLERELQRRTQALDAALAELEQRSDEDVEGYRGMIGSAPAMRRVYRLIERVAPSPFSVLVRGESGTGKELVARAIHGAGPRRAQPFVAINCAAMPDTLLESELFGYARGAFTGAVQARRGLFEQADGGTLLLDEVGDMSLAMQVKLLRVLETGELRRLGEARPRHVDVRVVAATNRDLEAMVGEGSFREDLLFRLNTVEITLPPLRERPGDVLPLARHFLQQAAERMGRPAPHMAPVVVDALERFTWPGNVRQLRSTLASLLVLGDEEVLDERALMLRPELARELAPGAGSGCRWDGRATLGQAKVQIARQAVSAHRGNKTRAARALGINRNTLYALLAQGAPRPDA